jgi:hypothetical protein
MELLETHVERALEQVERSRPQAAPHKDEVGSETRERIRHLMQNTGGELRHRGLLLRLDELHFERGLAGDVFDDEQPIFTTAASRHRCALPVRHTRQLNRQDAEHPPRDRRARILDRRLEDLRPLSVELGEPLRDLVAWDQ